MWEALCNKIVFFLIFPSLLLSFVAEPSPVVKYPKGQWQGNEPIKTSLLFMPPPTTHKTGLFIYAEAALVSLQGWIAVVRLQRGEANFVVPQIPVMMRFCAFLGRLHWLHNETLTLSECSQFVGSSFEQFSPYTLVSQKPRGWNSCRSWITGLSLSSSCKWGLWRKLTSSCASNKWFPSAGLFYAVASISSTFNSSLHGRYPHRSGLHSRIQILAKWNE